MSDKLSPKPANKRPLWTWSDLNDMLQMTFTTPGDSNPSTVIDIDRYEMSYDELKTEAESKGYKVSIVEDGLVRIE